MPPTFLELGQTGLIHYGGVVREDYLRELLPPRWQKNVKEMLVDPIISAALFAIEMLTRQVTWDIQAASEDNADQEAAQFVRECLFEDMSQDWRETIAEIHSYLPWGFSVHEIVYKRRAGESNDPSRNSKFTDGRIGWRKWPIRSQDSVDRWEFDENGGIQGVHQWVQSSPKSALIPIDKMLLFRTSAHKNNPEGKPLCRPIFKPWYFKKQIEMFEAIGVERDLAGLPFGKMPSDYLAATEGSKKQIADDYKKILTNLRNNEQGSLAIPSDRDEHGHPLFEFQLMGAAGAKQFDTDKIIRRKNIEILLTFMADFLLLGHEKVGSFALSSDKTDLFSVALGSFLDADCEIVNRHAIPRLLKLNGLPTERIPKLTHGDIESVDLVQLGTFISQLAGANIKLRPEQLAYVLEQGGLPVPEDEDELAEMLVPNPSPAPMIPDGVPLIGAERQGWIRRVPKKAKGLFLKRGKSQKASEGTESMRRIVIVGGPHVGKTTLANRLKSDYGFSKTFHSDDVKHLGWSESSEHASKWFDESGEWVIEGVQMARALRKWLKANPDTSLDADVVVLSQSFDELLPGQVSMAKGVQTVMREIEPELKRRGARVHRLSSPDDVIELL